MSALKELQSKIGATPDGGFGPETLKKAMLYFKMSKEEAAHFFGQCAHESVGLTVFTENLNYSSEGLLKIFKKYFPTETLAKQYSRQPVKIASRVYANRMGNGDEQSQDGWKYRGRGAIQLTGKTNYTLFANSVKDTTIIAYPDQVSEKYAFDSAKWFFDTNDIFDLCKTVSLDSITKVTKKINGGTNGLQDRIKLTNRYYAWLA